jgi:hypothetical protein
MTIVMPTVRSEPPYDDLNDRSDEKRICRGRVKGKLDTPMRQHASPSKSYFWTPQLSAIVIFIGVVALGHKKSSWRLTEVGEMRGDVEVRLDNVDPPPPPPPPPPISFGELVNFFDSSHKETLNGVLGKLKIKRLEVDYTYGNAEGDNGVADLYT